MSLMPQSHLHIKAVLHVRATQGSFREMEWDGAALVAVTGSMWQLRGLHGCYGVRVALTGRLPCTARNSHVHPVSAVLLP